MSPTRGLSILLTANDDWTEASEILAAHWGALSASWSALMKERAGRLSRSLPALVENSQAGTDLKIRLLGELRRSNSHSKFVERAGLLLAPEAIRCGHRSLAKRKDALERWLCGEQAPEPRHRLRTIVAGRDRAVNVVALRALVKGFCWTDLPRVVERCEAERLMWPFIETSFRNFVSRAYRERKLRGTVIESLTDAAAHVAAPGGRVDVALERAQLRGLKQSEVSAFLTQWYLEELARHAKGRPPAPPVPIMKTAPSGLPPGLDPHCTDCLQLWVLVLSLLERSRQDIAALTRLSPVYVGVLRTRALQRLREDLTRQPILLDYSEDRRGWGVLLSGWLLWDQVVDLSCGPMELGTFSAFSSTRLQVAEGWRHSGYVAQFRPNRRPTGGPTAVVFEDECVAGGTTAGAVLMNQARLTAGTGGGVVHAWVEVPPSFPGTEQLPLTLSATAPGLRVTARGATASLPVTLKIPPRAFRIDVEVQTAAGIPEPAHVEVAPRAGVGGHHDEEVTALVTLGSVLVAETATSRVSGVLAIAPDPDAPARIDLSSSDPSIARPLVERWTSDTAVFDIGVKTSRVPAATDVEIVAAGPTRHAGGLLSVRAPELRSVVFDADKLLAGAEVTGTVAFASPVSGPTAVRLAVKYGGVECHPPSVTVADGQKSTSFMIRAADEARSGVASIVASANDSEASTDIKVVPNEVRQFTLDSDKVEGGARVKCRVTSLRPVAAPVEVRVVGTDGLGRVVPFPVMIAAGSDTGSFEVETRVVEQYCAIEVVVEAFSTRKSKELRIVPPVRLRHEV